MKICVDSFTFQYLRRRLCGSRVYMFFHPYSVGPTSLLIFNLNLLENGHTLVILLALQRVRKVEKPTLRANDVKEEG